MDPQAIINLVTSPGATLALLGLGLLWFNRKLDKAEIRAVAERELAESRVVAERDAYRAERDKRITLLEKEVQECKDDRRLIREESIKREIAHREEMNSLQQEVRALLRSQIPLSKETKE